MGTLNSTFNDNVAFAKQAAGVRQQAAGSRRRTRNPGFVLGRP